jgi:hypothetical protein
MAAKQEISKVTEQYEAAKCILYTQLRLLNVKTASSMSGAFLVVTVRRVLRLRMEETASTYEG